MAVGPSKRRNLKKRETKEINMMPLMNLFLVIIPMLMMLWGATQLAFLYIDVSGGGSASGAGESSKKNKKQVEKAELKVGIFPDLIQIQVGKDEPNKILALDSSDGKVKYDYQKLYNTLANLREKEKRLDGVQEVKVYPSPNVKYDALLKTIDICKSNDFTAISYTTVKPSFARVRRK